MPKAFKASKIIEFLQESNAIEGVYDDDSLKQAKYAWDFLRKQKKICSGIVLKTHKILMLHQALHPYEKGYLRRGPVWIGSREGEFYQKVPKLMENWCRQMNLVKGWEEIKKLHVVFEKIHPFIDGNGRIGRILMNWARRKNKLGTLVILEEKRWKYYEWFD